jgi:hypothetical protein
MLLLCTVFRNQRRPNLTIFVAVFFFFVVRFLLQAHRQVRVFEQSEGAQ